MPPYHLFSNIPEITMKKILLSACVFLVCGNSVAGMKTIDLTLHGVLVAPPNCQIPGNSVININLGDKIISSQINGSNYIANLSIPISCTGSPAGVEMGLYGDATSFDSQIMQTTRPDLGIKFLRNGSMQPINSWFAIDYTKSVDMQIAPVKRTGTTIGVGQFSAIATVSLRLP